MLPLVALVGRPNVGKSTLFNALTRTRDALVHDQPGVTRDRQYGVCRLLEGRPFALVDTGGLSGEEAGLAGMTAQQARAGVDEADVVVFVVDGRQGASALDETILAWLRKSAKPVLLAVNKTDGLDAQAALAEFARFGIAAPLAVSSAHQRGIPELLAAIGKLLPTETVSEAPVDPERLRLAIVGRPNVGKSTLVNRLLGEERVIASEVPGTTRDSISIDLERDGRKYQLIDTAGIRRRGKVEDAIEKFSVIKTLQSIDAAQVVLLMLDASEGVTEQDATVLGHVLDSGRAFVLVVNKWDGLSTYQREQCEGMLGRKLGFVEWAERVRVSAKHGSGLREMFKAVHRAQASAMRKFSTSEVNKAIEIAVAEFPPPSVRGRAAKMRYGHPGGENPPMFVIHGNRLKALPATYIRYLENFFRKRFKLVGTPVRFEFREGQNPYEDKKNTLTPRQQRDRQRMIRTAKKRER
ncbi:MAG: ribosome biogenesis GTPase Der [Proteobacteria bacterium]|nr:ribosome biogenesis GTPase Der [Pseudomonadota bacterium]